MNGRFFLTLTIGLAFTTAALAADPEAPPTPATDAAPAVETPKASQTFTNAEPTEAEMRDAVQRYLNNANAQMRPAPSAPTTTTQQQRSYAYSPYWRYGYYGYYHKESRDSQYENWTDVARRASATTRVEITSFKKIRCTPQPEQQGFLGDYIAELEVRGTNPAAEGIMQTSGKPLKGFFYRGDKGWIFGEANGETK